MQHNLQAIMTRKKTVPLFADLQKTRAEFIFIKMKITIGLLLFSPVVGSNLCFLLLQTKSFLSIYSVSD